MTGGYSEGFNMSEVMKSRGKRPGFFEVPSDQHQIRESDAVASLSWYTNIPKKKESK